jgi:hypothetical protein
MKEALDSGKLPHGAGKTWRNYYARAGFLRAVVNTFFNCYFFVLLAERILAAANYFHAF